VFTRFYVCNGMANIIGWKLFTERNAYTSVLADVGLLVRVMERDVISIRER